MLKSIKKFFGINTDAATPAKMGQADPYNNRVEATAPAAATGTVGAGQPTDRVVPRYDDAVKTEVAAVVAKAKKARAPKAVKTTETTVKKTVKSKAKSA